VADDFFTRYPVISGLSPEGSQLNDRYCDQHKFESSNHSVENTESLVLPHQRTILIADDDAIFRTVAAELVRSWGYDCTTADDGETALRVLTQDKAPTIALLDWLMPKLTGTEICRLVRNSPSRQYIYFMLVSARDGREDSLEALRSGADTYISKPLDADELRAKLEIASRILSMEESVRDAHAETELFINSVPSILIGTDTQGRITRWNDGAATVFGVDKKTATADSDGNGFGTWWRDPGIQDQIAGVLHTGSTSRGTLPFNRQDSQRLIGMAIHPLRSHLGAIVGSVITGSDVTDKKILEDQLRQTQKLEAIGQLAAGIAHEINTPAQFVSDNFTFLKESWESVAPLLIFAQELTLKSESATTSESALTVRNTASALDLQYLLQEVPKSLDQTLDGLQRIKKIVRAIREFSHPSSNRKQHTDINAAIQTTVIVSRSEWKYVAELDTQLDPDLPLVPCVADQINQVVLNIIVNASHAIAESAAEGTAKKGQITIRTRHDQDCAEITISDTGGGIPEEIRARVFEPFFSTKQVGKGTGQGLALAHTIVVKEHNGRIWFDSEPGKGTTFFIRLPLTASADARDSAAGAG
jgi:two-component system, NtrC family, sensor kinase